MLTSDISSLLRSYRSSHNPNPSLTEERDCVTNHNDVRELITNISEVTSSVIDRYLSLSFHFSLVGCYFIESLTPI